MHTGDPPEPGGAAGACVNRGLGGRRSSPRACARRGGVGGEMGVDGVLGSGRNRSPEKYQCGGRARRGWRGCCETRGGVRRCPGNAQGREEARGEDGGDGGSRWSPESSEDGVGRRRSEGKIGRPGGGVSGVDRGKRGGLGGAFEGTDVEAVRGLEARGVASWPSGVRACVRSGSGLGTR